MGPDYRTAAEYFRDQAAQERWNRTHNAGAMSTKIITTVDRGNVVELSFDMEQAAAPIRWRVAGDDEWQATPYQTADAGHDAYQAERLTLQYLGQMAA